MLRDLPISWQRLLAVLAGGFLAVLLAIHFLLPAGTATQSVPLPPVGAASKPRPPAAVVVDVVGAVRRPGLYRLRKGDRIADALAKAGGAGKRADLARVNLAAPLADGEQIVVPRRDEAAATAGAGAGTAAGAPVDLNTASLEQLESLPGIGPVTAQKILDFRQQHGAFSSLAELDAIPGIGAARLDQLKGVAVP